MNAVDLQRKRSQIQKFLERGNEAEALAVVDSLIEYVNGNFFIDFAEEAKRMDESFREMDSEQAVSLASALMNLQGLVHDTPMTIGGSVSVMKSLAVMQLMMLERAVRSIEHIRSVSPRNNTTLKQLIEMRRANDNIDKELAAKLLDELIASRQKYGPQ